MIRLPRLGVPIAAVLLAAGCGSTVAGTPIPVGAFRSGAATEFTSLLSECDAVSDQRIAEAVGGDAIERGFFGAICRWSVEGASGPARVTFDWFEAGSLDVERATAERLGYAVAELTVEGRRAVLARQPKDPASCGISVGAPDSGVIGWWVQYQAPGRHPDPCEAVTTLAKLASSLSR
ncbi:DUF3558 domain-containing protein [Rhodococcus sp. ABRD24]|uniref:DUF3558 domain-containing protein n=1 Tax=Rhodococcus sp. ABRD24 TaxID=2507582 RepID=UPI00103F4920|nr:DUF3558 domain-containing protein [Rhodococcus sp. ABRD24]QBJ95636.1 DUF3558 domain-containing protein [Rhodococcus sp. ABRD24]